MMHHCSMGGRDGIPSQSCIMALSEDVPTRSKCCAKMHHSDKCQPIRGRKRRLFTVASVAILVSHIPSCDGGRPHQHRSFMYQGRPAATVAAPQLAQSHSSWSPVASTRSMFSKQGGTLASLSPANVFQSVMDRWNSAWGSGEGAGGGESNASNMRTGEDGAKSEHVDGTVLYRFYGRSRTRSDAASVPLIFLGSNVDHFQRVGRLMASRGFSVMACEQIKDSSSRDQSTRTSPQQHQQQQQQSQQQIVSTTGRIAAPPPRGSDGSAESDQNIVARILKELRWNQVILVGFDDEAIVAIESALQLAPDAVVGLILSGDLVKSDRLARDRGFPVLDSFLRRTLRCPFIIIWDGDTPPALPIAASTTGANQLRSDDPNPDRRLIHGSSPHRTQSEQFTWILTRFIEEKISKDHRNTSLSPKSPPAPLDRFFATLPFGIDALVTEEGRIVIGRAMATAIFYIAVMRILVVQYGLLSSGIATIKSRYDSFDALRKRVFQVVKNFILNFGYLPRLFRIRRASDDEDEEQSPPQQDKADGGDADADAKDDTDADDAEPSESNDMEEYDSDNEEKEQEEQRNFRPRFFLDHVIA